MKNAQVANAWASGRSATAKHFKTDGKTLWSYDLAIAERDEWGNAVIKDYTAACNRFVSQTTSQHVGHARQACVMAGRPARIEVPE
jgi:hypothetical protein